MDAHERFLAHRTTEVSLLLDLASNNSDTLSRLIDGFNCDVRKIDKLQDPPKYFETVRTVLCSFYKEREDSHDIKDLTKPLMYQLYSQTFMKINVNEVQIAVYTQKLNAETMTLLLDILVLQMVIYHNHLAIVVNWDVLQKLIHLHFDKGDYINTLDIKLMNCYMDSLFLFQRSRGLAKLLPAERVAAPFLRNMDLWLRLENRKNCLLFTQVVSKLIKMINDNEITRQTWNLIFLLGDDPRNVLTMLCLTADVWFPMDSEYNEQLIKQTTEEPLWWLLLKGLSSSMPQQRKEALSLTKRIVDFTDKHTSQGIELGEYNHIRPLICTGDNARQILFKKNLNNYLLTLEALEEKEKHLVTPVFPLLKALLDETYDKENCQSGLHIAWIRCAFTLMLQHDNSAIVKWGLQNILSLDPELYDDEFLSKVIDVLNRTWLYENDVNDEEPSVVKELARLLNNAEATNSDLVTRFVIKASRMTWEPVALFYVIRALFLVKKVCSLWKEVELEAVKSLAEINSKMPCRMLRIGSQIELLETMTHFSTESLDLIVIANTLSAFSSSEALIRSQFAWNQTSAWLSKTVKKDEAISFLEEICKQMTDEGGQRDLNVESFSLIIMLLYDAHLILNSKLCPGLTALRNLLQCLIAAASRPHANVELRNRSIALIGHLLDFASSKDCILHKLISDYADATLRFIFTTLRNISNTTSVDDIDTYVMVTRQFFIAENSIIPNSEVLNHIDRFEVEARNIIQDGVYSNMLQRFFGIKILYFCPKTVLTKLKNYKFIGPLYNTYKTITNQSSKAVGKLNNTFDGNTVLKNKIAAEYYEFVAELFYEYVEEVQADEWIPDIDWIEQVLYLIEIGGKEIFIPSVGILSQIFYKGAVKPTDIVHFKTAVRLCWKAALDCCKSQLALEEIINLIFSPLFLECKETRKLTIECTNEMMSNINKTPGLSIILVNGLKQVKGEYLFNFHNALLACLLHGTVPTIDQKIELRANADVLRRYQELYPNYLSNMNVNISVTTRVHAITLLHRIITDDPTYAVKLLPLIFAKLDEIRSKRYFADSQIHRLENRIMQTLLILQPILEKDMIEILYSSLCDNILLESSQPSVRIMQEWLLIRIYLESGTLRAKIWEMFDQGRREQVVSLCSVVSIVYHVARLISSDLQLDFINLALQYIMPCCMIQQCDVSSYAQVVASKLYNLAIKMSYSTLTEKYRGLYIAVTESLNYGRLMKSSTKLRDDFYFTAFNPIDDYSLETLFYELPRLSNVAADEYIPIRMFEKLGFKESNSHPLKMFNLKNDMSKAPFSAHISNYSGDTFSLVDEIDTSHNCFNDVQHQCIRRKTIIPRADGLDVVHKSLDFWGEALTERNKIILVASLIDELPNLRGLSRTCETLGVEEFVTSSIEHTMDEEYQNLSVSAKKLISLVEVKPDLLQSYLLAKKNVGYRLVGVEPTVNSTNLMDMKFDKKIVLLLGNEKRGIPVNLTPILDDYVGIPQVGTVHPLNVHVIGAICLWEYFKQHQKS